MDPLEEDLPDLLKIDRVCRFLLDNCEIAIGSAIIFRDLFSRVVSYVLEHTNCNQVVIDVAASVARVHVNGIEHSDKVLLAQPIDVIADD